MSTAYHLEALRRQRMIDRVRKASEQIEAEAIGNVASPELGRTYSEKGADRPQSVVSAIGNSEIVESQSLTASNKHSSRPVSVQSSTSKRSIEINFSNDSGRGSKQSSRPISVQTIDSHLPSSPPPHSDQASAHGQIKDGVRNTGTTSIKKSKDGNNDGFTNIPLNGQLDNASIKSRQGSSHSKSRDTTPKRSESRGLRSITPAAQSGSSSRDTTPKSSESRRSRSNLYSKRSSSKLSDSSITGSQRSSSSNKADIKADQVRQELHKQEVFLRDSNLVMGNILVDEEIKLKGMEQGLA